MTEREKLPLPLVESAQQYERYLANGTMLDRPAIPFDILVARFREDRGVDLLDPMTPLSKLAVTRESYDDPFSGTSMPQLDISMALDEIGVSDDTMAKSLKDAVRKALPERVKAGLYSFPQAVFAYKIGVSALDPELLWKYDNDGFAVRFLPLRQIELLRQMHENPELWQRVINGIFLGYAPLDTRIDTDKLGTFLNRELISDGDTVIDIGCESGYLTAGIARHNPASKVIGIEGTRIEQVRDVPSNFEFRYGDINRLPLYLPADSADIVMATGVMQRYHLDARVTILAAMGNGVREGGKVLVGPQFKGLNLFRKQEGQLVHEATIDGMQLARESIL